MAASTAPVVNKPLTVANAILPTEPTELPSEYYVARWYAAYTSANHEKGVAKQLDERSVEHSLLLYESVRRWKDRRVKLQSAGAGRDSPCGIQWCANASP